jgi:hypothetical protein
MVGSLSDYVHNHTLRSRRCLDAACGVLPLFFAAGAAGLTILAILSDPALLPVG